MKQLDGIILRKRLEFGKDLLSKWYNPHDTIEVNRELFLQIISLKKISFMRFLMMLRSKIRLTFYVSLILLCSLYFSFHNGTIFT